MQINRKYKISKKKKADECESQKILEQARMHAIEEERIKVLEFERQQAYELQKLKFLRAEATRATVLQKLWNARFYSNLIVCL